MLSLVIVIEWNDFHVYCRKDLGKKDVLLEAVERAKLPKDEAAAILDSSSLSF